MRSPADFVPDTESLRVRDSSVAQTVDGRGALQYIWKLRDFFGYRADYNGAGVSSSVRHRQRKILKLPHSLFSGANKVVDKVSS
jgi:hypothetical protein